MTPESLDVLFTIAEANFWPVAWTLDCDLGQE